MPGGLPAHLIEFTQDAGVGFQETVDPDGGIRVHDVDPLVGMAAFQFFQIEGGRDRDLSLDFGQGPKAACKPPSLGESGHEMGDLFQAVQGGTDVSLCEALKGAIEDVPAPAAGDDEDRLGPKIQGQADGRIVREGPVDEGVGPVAGGPAVEAGNARRGLHREA